MEMDVGVLLEPALVLLVGVEVVEDDVQLPAREDGDEPVHEAEELDPAAPFRMRRVATSRAANKVVVPRTIFQPIKAVVGKAMSPLADNARLNPHLRGDRRVLRPSAASNTIRARCASRCGVVGARY
jgi:hypothetical protein